MSFAILSDEPKGDNEEFETPEKPESDSEESEKPEEPESDNEESEDSEEPESKRDHQELEPHDFDTFAALEGPIIWALITELICFANGFIRSFRSLSRAMYVSARAAASPDDAELVAERSRLIEILVRDRTTILFDRFLLYAINDYARDSREAALLSDHLARKASDSYQCARRTRDVVLAFCEDLCRCQEIFITHCEPLVVFDKADNDRFYGATYAVEDVLCEAASVFRDPLSDPEAIAEFAVEVAEAIRPFYDLLDLPNTAEIVNRFENTRITPAAWKISKTQLSKAYRGFSSFLKMK